MTSTNDWLGGITWKEQTAECAELLKGLAGAEINPLKGGLEAEVYHINMMNPDTELVLKIWNRESRPDISLQYSILEQMHRQGLAVSQPWGWGIDTGHNQVLLTSYDGVPAKKVNPDSLTVMASILLDIHKVNVASLSDIRVPAYDFADYFFYAIDGYPEIREQVLKLADQAGMTREHLIHADYHPGNILEADGAYTVIDWTNVQLGDPRYDIAWSVTLVRIYAGERYSKIYRSAFLALSGYPAAELELFEAIACLRWLQLHRTTGAPLGPATIKTVRSIMHQNRYLPDGLL